MTTETILFGSYTLFHASCPHLLTPKLIEVSEMYIANTHKYSSKLYFSLSPPSHPLPHHHPIYTLCGIVGTLVTWTILLQIFSPPHPPKKSSPRLLSLEPVPPRCLAHSGPKHILVRLLMKWRWLTPSFLRAASDSWASHLFQWNDTLPPSLPQRLRGRAGEVTMQTGHQRWRGLLFTNWIGTWENKWLSHSLDSGHLPGPSAFTEHRPQLAFMEMRSFHVPWKASICPRGAPPGSVSRARIHGRRCWGPAQRCYSSRSHSPVPWMVHCHVTAAPCDLHEGSPQHRGQ